MGRRATSWTASLVGIGLALALGTLSRPAPAQAEDRAPPPVVAPVPDAPPDAVPAPAPAPVAPKPLTLDRAVEKGLLQVVGISPTSYTTVLLVLANLSNEALLLDVSGRHLEPTTGAVQRLGLSFPITPLQTGLPATPGTTLVTLAPGERREIRMNTCCMDGGRACPRPGDKYVLAKAATPPAVEMALRWWVDHPRVEQGFVNAAIWQHDPRLLDAVPAPEHDATDASAWPRTTAVRSYQGVLYLLDAGALTSIDPEGVRRFHATGIYQVFPGPGGLLAVGRGASGRELWRFGVTGDPPWSKQFSLDTFDLQALVAPSGGSFLALAPTGLSFRASKEALGTRRSTCARATGPRRRGSSSGVLDAAKGRAVAFAWRKGVARGGPISSANVQERSPTLDVYDVDGRAGTAKLRRTFWNVRHVGAGPAGTFALTPNGQLERLDGERLVRLASDHEWARVRAVGTKRLLLQAEGTELYAYDLKSGRSTALPADAQDASIDPVTDDLVWIAGETAARWSPGLAEPEKIPLR